MYRKALLPVWGSTAVGLLSKGELVLLCLCEQGTLVYFTRPMAPKSEPNTHS